MCKNYCTFYWYNNLFFNSLVIYEDRQMVIFKDLHVKTFTYCNLHFSFSNNEDFFLVLFVQHNYFINISIEFFIIQYLLYQHLYNARNIFIVFI